jgi:hypothetical protein
MTHSIKLRSRRATRVLVAAAPLAGLLVAGAPAVAAAPPVVAGLTITPSTVAVGAGAQVVATATNTTGAPVDASMGENVPAHFAVSGVSGTSGCTPRNLTRLVYCGVQSLPAGATATITFTVTPNAAGSYTFQSYARILYATDNSLATAALTVS